MPRNSVSANSIDMAKRTKLEDRLRSLHEVSNDPFGDVATSLIRKELESASAFTVAAAAEIVAEHELTDLGDLLPAAFERFMEDPIKSDPACRAKVATIDAMVRLELPAEDLYLRAVNYEQWEPVYGNPPRVDTAGPIRGACGFGLVQLHHPDAMRNIAVLLVDPHQEARAQAIRAAQCSHEHEAAAAMLRMKAKLGDEESHVLRECLEGLLTVDGERALSFVADFLASDAIEAECAALALGAGRVDGAFEVLRAWHKGRLRPSERAVASIAIVTLRSDEALDFLFKLIEEGDVPVATDALKALAIYSYDDTIRERAALSVASEPHLRAVFDATFSKE